MKPFFSATFVLASVTIGAISPSRAQEANPILLELRPQLQAAMEKVAPDAMWELKGNELMASYKTREFVIYPISSNGIVAAQPQQEIGPANGGLILRVRVFWEIPHFAFEAPLLTRQPYWRTYVTRNNLRAGALRYSALPSPIPPNSEAASGSDERLEFENAPQWTYPQLLNIENAGLFQIARAQKISAAPLTRYESAVLLAKLQDAIPDLTANKSRRITALQAGTAKIGRQLSPAEIEVLDKDIRDLQTEFSTDLQKLEARTGSVIEERPPYRIPPRRVLPEPKSKPAYLVFTLQTPLNHATTSPQPFTQIIEATVERYNRIADDK